MSNVKQTHKNIKTLQNVNCQPDNKRVLTRKTKNVKHQPDTYIRMPNVNQRMSNVNQAIKESQISTRKSKNAKVKCQPDNQTMSNVNYLIKTSTKIELNLI